MTETNGFADRDRVDLTKTPGPDPRWASGPESRDPMASTSPDLPSVGSDFWQPYEIGGDPLAALDPVYPPYPVAYPPSAYPTGPYAANPHFVSPYLMAAYPALGPVRTNSMANTAMVCAIVAFPAMFFCFAGALIAPVAVVLGIVSLGQIRQRPYESGESQAWTGIALGGVLTTLSVAFGLWVVLAASL